MCFQVFHGDSHNNYFFLKKMWLSKFSVNLQKTSSLKVIEDNSAGNSNYIEFYSCISLESRLDYILLHFKYTMYIFTCYGIAIIFPLVLNHVKTASNWQVAAN